MMTPVELIQKGFKSLVDTLDFLSLRLQHIAVQVNVRTLHLT